MSCYGFVYVLSNPSMPGIYKIGMTMRSPTARADELSKATGVPTRFCVVYYVECENPTTVERDLHEYFSDCRVNGGREFFKLDLFDVVDWCMGHGVTISEWIGEETQIAVDLRVSNARTPNSPAPRALQ